VVNGLESLVDAVIRSEVIEDLATRRRHHVYICSVKGRIFKITRFADNTSSCRLLPAKP
jgi:hypothetical protein